MLDLSTEIVLASGGTLQHEAPEPYQPSAATVTLYTPSGAVHVASQSATVGPAGALGSAAAAKAKTITLADTNAGVAGVQTGLVPGRYVIRASSGLYESIRIRSIDQTTGVATLAEPLQNGYTSGAVIFSRRLSVAVSALQATPLGEAYEARWAWTSDGTARHAVTYWDVVRAAWDETVFGTEDFREWAASSGDRSLQTKTADDFAGDISRAVSLVKADLLEKAYRPGRFRSAAGFQLAVFERVLLEWAEKGTSIPSLWQPQPQAYLEARQAAYAQALSQALNVTPYDADQSGTAEVGERQQKGGSVRIRR